MRALWCNRKPGKQSGNTAEKHGAPSGLFWEFSSARGWRGPGTAKNGSVIIGKEECRELIKSITHAATLHLNIGSGTSQQQAYDAYLETVKTFHDRIFIAKDLEQENLLHLWAHAVGDNNNGKIDHGEFSDRVEALIKTIISFAFHGK